MRHRKPWHFAGARRAPALVLILVVAAAHSTPGHAAEGYRLRHPAVGLFGGDILSTPAGEGGFFATSTLTYTQASAVADDSGNPIGIAPRLIALPTANASGGTVPNGTYNLSLPQGSIRFSQHQTQLNVVAGYATAADYAGGRLVFRINVPMVSTGRSFGATVPAGTIVPTPGPPLPGNLVTAINIAGGIANAQVQATVASNVASQNASSSGVGDVELSAGWLRTIGSSRIAAALAVQLPTGDYDAARGPNAGYGDFRTWHASVVGVHDFSGAGVVAAARLAWATNSTNRDTNYKTGDFMATEFAIAKPLGNWAVGANVLALRQLANDTSNGVPVAGMRYRTNSAGPFISYKMPARDIALNLHASRTFGERNAFRSKSIQARLIASWR